MNCRNFSLDFYIQNLKVFNTKIESKKKNSQNIEFEKKKKKKTKLNEYKWPIPCKVNSCCDKI